MSKRALRPVWSIPVRVMSRAMLGLAAAACAGPMSDAPTAVELDQPSASVSVLATAPTSPGWHTVARGLVAANNQSPLMAGRVYAALSVAQYQAVVQADAADLDGTLAENGVGRGGRAAREAQRGAVAGASAEVLSFFYAAKASEFAARVESEAGPSLGNVHPAFTRGLAIGKQVGAAVVTRLKGDRFTTPWNQQIETGPDKWERAANSTPAGITLGGMKTWVINDVVNFRAPAPPAYGSPAFLAELAEIKTIELQRDASQIGIANYWNFPGGTFTPIGYWDSKAAEYIAMYGLDERAATRAFALTNVAMMDALIACWESKYYWLVRRPSQVNSSISLVFGLPNHPSYPSGHSCSSAAAAAVMSQLFPQQANTLAAYVAEAGLSRKYAGIHYQFDITAGENLGRAVAQYTMQQDAAVGLLGAINH